MKLNFDFAEKRIYRLLLLAVSAILTALCLVYPKMGFLEWFSLIPCAIAMFSFAEKGIKPLEAFFYGLFFFGIYYVVIYHWFVAMYPMSFLGISKFASAIVVAAALIGLPLIQAIPCALIFLAVVLFSRFGLLGKKRLMLPFIVASLWTLSEWLLTFGTAGVPWSRLAIGQTSVRVMIQSASLFGSYFISFIVVAVNFLLAYVLFYRRYRAVIIPVSLFSLNLLIGMVLLISFKDIGSGVTVAGIQGNISSAEKWTSDSYVRSLEVYTDKTLAAVEEGAEIVVWPESVIPYDLLDDRLETTRSLLSKLSRTREVEILVGALEKNDERLYNKVFLFSADGEMSDEGYYKQHLVPFGEYVPFRRLVEIFIPQLLQVNATDEITAGESSSVITTSKGKIGCSICFDSIYEDITRREVLNGAGMIAVATNESWFSASAELSMHTAQAVLRAVESRRYVVRAANTGISAIISPTGEVVDSLGALRRGYVIYEVRMRDDITFYTLTGNLFVGMCGAFIFGIVSVDIFYKILKRKSSRLK